MANITTNILPSGSSFYVKANAQNPSTIEVGGSATLKFSADGMYYTLNKAQASAVTVTGATIQSWTTASPFTEGTLIITNATGDVSVTLTARVGISPQVVAKPFSYKGKAPLDVRTVLTKEQMNSVLDTQQPNTYFAICEDDQKVYVYNKNWESNGVTGKFRPINDSWIVGYYHNNSFYTDSTYTQELETHLDRPYYDLNGDRVYRWMGLVDGYQQIHFEGVATETEAGLTKLYKTSGQNEDGTMTQKAVTEGVKGIKFATEVVDTNNNGIIDANDQDECLVLELPW